MLFSPSTDSEQTSFYSGATAKVPSDSRPYSLTDFEESPLGRPKSVLGPGTAWNTANKKLVYDYLIHDGTTNPIKVWKIVSGSTKKDDYPQSSANYGAGQVQIMQVTSEQGVVSQTCTDNRGLTVAERTLKGSTWVTTYYVYDDFGQLRFIIPPKISTVSSPTSAQVAGLMFSYIYDGRGRLTYERGPGQDWTYYCYDKWDRVVLSQDPAMRITGTNNWTFYKYDINNRLIMTGRETISTNPDTWWSGTAKNSTAARYETRNTGSSHGYSTSSSLPTSINEVYTITYYDDYVFIGSSGWDAEGIGFTFNADGFGLVQQTLVKGLTTGSKVLNLATNTWLNTVVYYDKYYRPIQVIAENHLGGYDRISSKLSYAGELEHSKLTHRKTTSSPDFTDLQRYEYDHAGRMLKSCSNINGQGEILLAQYEYNELGDLIDKKVYSTNSGTSFLQSIDYRYTIRGSLETINNPALNSDGVTNDETNDVFGARYHYQKATLTVGSESITSRYDGSLQALEWRNANVSGSGGKNFNRAISGYQYDGLGQMTAARYATGDGTTWGSNAGKYDEQVTYADDNGNIGQLIRENGGATDMDNLTYTYQANTNKLSLVGESGDAAKGFKNLGTGVANEYTYDNAGNLTKDEDKHITDIDYNYLQMVTKITFYDGTTINYVYDAVGNRLSKTVIDGSGNVLGKVDYVGAIEYADDEIAQLYTDEGRAYKQNGKFHYEYMLTDHQGNNRVSFGVLPERYEYLATMETERATKENADFAFPANLRTTAENHTPTPGNESCYLNGYNAARNVGVAKVLTIASGDQVELEVFAKYTSETWNGSQVAGIVGLVQDVFELTASGATAEGINAVANALNAPTASTGLFGNAGTNEPSAYLQWMFFNQSYNLVTGALPE